MLKITTKEILECKIGTCAIVSWKQYGDSIKINDILELNGKTAKVIDLEKARPSITGRTPDILTFLFEEVDLAPKE